MYHAVEDFAENHNVAAENWPRLIEMIAQWYVEAGKYNVLPVDGRGQQRFADERPQIAVYRTSYTYTPDTQEVPMNAAARIINRPHSITADVEIVEGDQGVLISQGGYSFYIQDSKLQYIYNYVTRDFYLVEYQVAVPAGRHRLRYEFEVTGAPDILKGKGSAGLGQLDIDDKLVGQVMMPVTNPIMLGLTSGVAIGADPGSPVTVPILSTLCLLGDYSFSNHRRKRGSHS